MKPLVLWCRWHDAKLRLRGRSPGAVWGELDFWKESRLVIFHFDLQTHTLTIGKEPDHQTVQLDEMGIEKKTRE